MSGETTKKVESETLAQNGSLQAGVKDLDYILKHHVGLAGKGQWGITAALLFIIIATVPTLNIHIYSAYEPRHRCLVEICEGSEPEDLLIDRDWVSFAIPQDYNGQEMLGNQEKFDPCHMNLVRQEAESCEPESFDNQTIVPCNKYVYDRSTMRETITTHLDLVCDKKWKRQYLDASLMAGLMVGGLIGGKLGDKLGRKRTITICLMILFPPVMFGGYCREIWSYTVLRGVACMQAICLWLCVHSMLVEIYDNETRYIPTMLKEFMFAFGAILTNLLFYLAQKWTYMHLVSGGVALLAIAVLPVIPESARWLISNGRTYEAMQVLTKIARWNGKTLSEEDRQEMLQIIEDSAATTDADRKGVDTLEEVQDGDVFPDASVHEVGIETLGFTDLFRRKYLKITLVLMVQWALANITTFTLSLNVGRLSGNIFVNSTLKCCVEIPGRILLMIALKFFGRKVNYFVVCSLTGAFCIATAFLPGEYEKTANALYMLADSGANQMFVMAYLVTSELYPTNLRTHGMGVSSTFARLVGISSAFIPALAHYWKPLPMLVLGVPCVGAACLIPLLPETRNMHLPQSDKRPRNILARKKV